ncbi:hypothetical protein QUF79_08830 [Fictibacillus enclensis]|uniref:hypothetical protein n=1 Tax=Fictibacillus enclensis TaxID=1017270 RepID=UPI00259FF889|nr:hypothetical protein [Fictibacillus enclensis]MDM5198122.1 hypothetical protein [Fictibacillus enclensis]
MKRWLKIIVLLALLSTLLTSCEVPKLIKPFSMPTFEVRPLSEKEVIEEGLKYKAKDYRRLILKIKIVNRDLIKDLDINPFIIRRSIPRKNYVTGSYWKNVNDQDIYEANVLLYTKSTSNKEIKQWFHNTEFYISWQTKDSEYHDEVITVSDHLTFLKKPLPSD